MEEVHEAEVLAKCAEGRVLDCGAVGKPGVVDAELLRRCCVEFRDQVDPRGVRLKNARIVGSLDLAGLDVAISKRRSH